jgi:hypothetical protein
MAQKRAEELKALQEEEHELTDEKKLREHEALARRQEKVQIEAEQRRATHRAEKAQKEDRADQLKEQQERFALEARRRGEAAREQQRKVYEERQRLAQEVRRESNSATFAGSSGLNVSAHACFLLSLQRRA